LYRNNAGSRKKVIVCYRNQCGNARRVCAIWISAKTIESGDEIGDYDEANGCFYTRQEGHTLVPHVAQRQMATLLHEAVKEIEELRNSSKEPISDNAHTDKIKISTFLEIKEI